MPSASPSRGMRPSLAERTSSTVSLSSSGKPSVATAGNKQPRPHLVSRHSRNVSHGRGLTNMPKKSMTTVYNDGTKHHRRVKSGTTTPVASPKGTAGGHMKRNSSHVVLPKNRSQGNLRKNQSTNTLTALNRNLSRGTLNKLGANAEQKAKQEAKQKKGFFEMVDGSDDDDEDVEEAEWEEASTASPELTRNNSKVSTPARALTPPNPGEPIQKQVSENDTQDLVPDKTSSPPSPVVIKTNRSAPNLRSERVLNVDRQPANPALLQQNGRAARAPPAMTTTNARSSQQGLPRNDSQRSLSKAAHTPGLGQTSLETLQDSTSSDTSAAANIKTSTAAISCTGTSISTSATTSHFLQPDPTLPRTPAERSLVDSDSDDSVSDFMANYKPQPSESPDAHKTYPRTNINKARIPSQPSRTQQKLELQRRELMRGTGPPSSVGGMALSASSSISLHSRTYSHSKARPKSMVGELKAIKAEYDTSVKQLTVVRRFKNPVLESIARLRQAGVIPSDAAVTQKRPPSRHSNKVNGDTKPSTGINGTSTAPARTGTTPDEPHHANGVTNNPHRGSKVSFAQPRGGVGRDSKVTFQLSREDSHEDILGAGQDSPDVGQDEYGDRMSLEEALIRRLWESRIHVA